MMVRLSLREAVVLALANSPTVKVVGYDPAISWQDVEKARATFDPLLFSTLSLDRTDARQRTSGTASKSKTVPFGVGVRKFMTTGGQIEIEYTSTRDEDNSTFAVFNPSYSNTFAVRLTQP